MTVSNTSGTGIGPTPRVPVLIGNTSVDVAVIQKSDAA